MASWTWEPSPWEAVGRFGEPAWTVGTFDSDDLDYLRELAGEKPDEQGNDGSR